MLFFVQILVAAAVHIALGTGASVTAVSHGAAGGILCLHLLMLRAALTHEHCTSDHSHAVLGSPLHPEDADLSDLADLILMQRIFPPKQPAVARLLARRSWLIHSLQLSLQGSCGLALLLLLARLQLLLLLSL